MLHAGRLKVLTEVEGPILGILCQAYSNLIKTQPKLTESNLLYKAMSGYPSINPLVSIIDGNVDTIIKIAREFGMTPASRTRIQVAAKENATVDGVLDF